MRSMPGKRSVTADQLSGSSWSKVFKQSLGTSGISDGVQILTPIVSANLTGGSGSIGLSPNSVRFSNATRSHHDLKPLLNTLKASPPPRPPSELVVLPGSSLPMLQL